MRTHLLGGAMLVLAPAPLLAQAATPPSSASSIDAPLTDSNSPTSDVTGRSGTPAPDGSPLDTLVPPDDAPPAPVVQKTGDAVLDRLNALEAKVAQLEARNHQLEEAAASTQERVQKVEVRAAKGVQPGPAPTFADVNDNFTFKPRGTFQIDAAAYNERAGGYDYNNGTDIRRARFGFDGTAFKVFKCRIEAEFVKNTVNLLDAYVQYVAIPKIVLTVGQQKAPYGLEANSTDALNTFLERGMANNAFGAVGAERRVGLSVAYQTDKLNAAVGLFGAGEAVQRNVTTPDEVYSVNGRVTWEPILDTGRVVHLGASAYHASQIAAKTVTLGDRPDNPNTRFVFNYIRFKGTNSPLVIAPVATYGTTAKGDAFASRLQFDF